MTGRRFSKRVRRYGVRPLPELYQALNPLADEDQAKATEVALTTALRAAGFRVWEGQPGDLRIETTRSQLPKVNHAVTG
jgi:hypothetical protein